MGHCADISSTYRKNCKTTLAKYSMENGQYFIQLRTQKFLVLYFPLEIRYCNNTLESFMLKKC